MKVKVIVKLDLNDALLPIHRFSNDGCLPLKTFAIPLSDQKHIAIPLIPMVVTQTIHSMATVSLKTIELIIK